MTTNTIESTNKRKWKRYDARAILTPLERRKLNDGSWKYDRHMRYKLRLKTVKAFSDLDLILNKMNPSDFLDVVEGVNRKDIIEKWLKQAINYYHKFLEREEMKERLKRGVKLTVSERQIQKQIQKVLFS